MFVCVSGSGSAVQGESKALAASGICENLENDAPVLCPSPAEPRGLGQEPIPALLEDRGVLPAPLRPSRAAACPRPSLLGLSHPLRQPGPLRVSFLCRGWAVQGEEGWAEQPGHTF